MRHFLHREDSSLERVVLWITDNFKKGDWVKLDGKEVRFVGLKIERGGPVVLLGKWKVGAIRFYMMVQPIGKEVAEINWGNSYMLASDWLMLDSGKEKAGTGQKLNNLEYLAELWSTWGKLIPEPNSELDLFLKRANREISGVDERDAAEAGMMIEDALNRNGTSLEMLKSESGV